MTSDTSANADLALRDSCSPLAVVASIPRAVPRRLFGSPGAGSWSGVARRWQALESQENARVVISRGSNEHVHRVRDRAADPVRLATVVELNGSRPMCPERPTERLTDLPDAGPVNGEVACHRAASPSVGRGQNYLYRFIGPSRGPPGRPCGAVPTTKSSNSLLYLPDLPMPAAPSTATVSVM